MSKIIRRERFEKIYQKEISSGDGSRYENTVFFREILDNIIDKYQIKSIVDLGCGDFISTKAILDIYPKIQYLGLDISHTIINDNQEKYPNYNFQIFDAVLDDLSFYKYDLIIFRHTLQHLNYQNAQKVINNIKNSSCKYLLVNHQLGLKTNDDNKLKEIDWENQMYNLNVEPFNMNKLPTKELEKWYDNEKNRIQFGQEETYSLYMI